MPVNSGKPGYDIPITHMEMGQGYVLYTLPPAWSGAPRQRKNQSPRKNKYLYNLSSWEKTWHSNS